MADPTKANPTDPTPSGQSPSAKLLAAKLEVSRESSFIGPLPPPSLLKGYEEVCPGAAKQIIEMAQAQSAHRRQTENDMHAAMVEDMRRSYQENRRGQICAVIVVLAFLVAGVYVAVSGHPWPGALLGGLGGGGVGLQTIINAFLRRHSELSGDEKPKAPVPSPRSSKRQK